jgi:hypothetical protein
MRLTATPAMLAALAKKAAPVPAESAVTPSANSTDSPSSSLPVVPEAPAIAESGEGGKTAGDPESDPARDAIALQARKERYAGYLERVRRAEAVLAAKFPAVFGPAPRPPLQVGVKEKIAEAVGDEVDPVDLAAFLRWWTSRHDYRDAIAHGEERRDLDGTPIDPPSERDRRQAAVAVYGKRAELVLGRIAARRAASTEDLVEPEKVLADAQSE